MHGTVNEYGLVLHKAWVDAECFATTVLEMHDEDLFEEIIDSGHCALRATFSVPGVREIMQAYFFETNPPDDIHFTAIDETLNALDLLHFSYEMEELARNAISETK